jgi:hypothetical protein
MDSFAQSLSALETLGFQKSKKPYDEETEKSHEKLLMHLETLSYVEPPRNAKPTVSSEGTAQKRNR